MGYAFSIYKKIDLKSINDVVIYITTPCLIISSLSKFPLDLTLAAIIFIVITAVVLVSIVIGIIILLIFGGSKIPKLFRDLGSGIREFKDGMAGKESEDKKESEKKS